MIYVVWSSAKRRERDAILDCQDTWICYAQAIAIRRVLIGCGIAGEEERRFEQMVYASECVNTEREIFIYKHESRM
jgi:hypothetical protein